MAILASGLTIPVRPSAGYALSDRRVANNVLGNTLWTLTHWLSHAVIEARKRPVDGDVETAADQLATLLLLEVRNRGPEGASSRAIDTMLGRTANVMSWVTVAKRAPSEELMPWGGHRASLARFREVVCIAYGGNPVFFGKLLQMAYWPEPFQDRARDCLDAYGRTRGAWGDVMTAMANPETKPSPARAIIVRFNPAAAKELDALRALVADSGVVDDLAEYIGAAGILGSEALIEFNECGGPDSGWDPGSRRVTICYELLATFPEWTYE
jgi:hypothetical protein